MMTEHLEQGRQGKSEVPAHTLGGAGEGPESSVQQLFEQRCAQRERLDMRRREQEREVAQWRQRASKHRGESWQLEKGQMLTEQARMLLEEGRLELEIKQGQQNVKQLPMRVMAALPQMLDAQGGKSIVALQQDALELLRAEDGKGAFQDVPRDSLRKVPPQPAVAEPLSPLVLPHATPPAIATNSVPSKGHLSIGGFGDLGGGFSSSAPCDDTTPEPVLVQCQLPGGSAGLHAQKEEKEKRQFGQEREETSPASDAPMGFEADAASLRLDVAQEQTCTTGAADRPAKSAKEADPLDMQVKLGLDFHLAGPPNSQHRAEFETVLVCDFPKASGLKPVGSELLPQGSRSVEPRTLATTLGGSELAPPSSRSVDRVEVAEILVKRICPTENIFCIPDEEVQTATTGIVVEHVAAGSRLSSEGKSSWGSWLFESEIRKCARCHKLTHKSSWKAW
jgi:hypothetical protein